MKYVPAQSEWRCTANLLREIDPLRFPEQRSLDVLQKKSWSFRQLTEWNHNIKQIEDHYGLLFNWYIIKLILDIKDSRLCNQSLQSLLAPMPKTLVATSVVGNKAYPAFSLANWKDMAHAHSTELSFPPNRSGCIHTVCGDWSLAHVHLWAILRICWNAPKAWPKLPHTVLVFSSMDNHGMAAGLCPAAFYVSNKDQAI